MFCMGWGWVLVVAAVAMISYSPGLGLTLSLGSTWIYTSQIAGIDLSMPIGDKTSMEVGMFLLTLCPS